MHVGSKNALCSKEPELEDAGSYRPSVNQKKLLEGWEYCIDELFQKPDVLVINGEPIDGSNPRTLGESTWSQRHEDQLNDAENLIKQIPYKDLYLVRGSGYHVNVQATSFERIFGKQMGARRYKSVMGNITHADFEATFEVYNKHIHFTHHVGYSGWWQYRSTPIARELVKMHFAHKANGFHTDVVVRSHVHYYVEVRFPNTKGFSNPAWKFPDGFLYRQGEPELPTIGMTEIIIEPNGRIDIEPHLVELNFKKPVIHL